MINEILQGDIREVVKTLPDESVNCIVTSPPYWGLRNYGMDDQIGLEDTPEAYVETMTAIFRELRRVLRSDGTCWLVLGDSYSSGLGEKGQADGEKMNGNSNRPKMELPPKNLCLIPHRVALALQADGWWVRQTIVWCLSGGTRVYAKTQKGEMPMTIKDLVRLNPETVKLWNGEKWTQVLGWSETPRPIDPIELELRSGERIGCTPSHKWPTLRGLVHARDLQVGDVIKTCRLPDRIRGISPEFIPDDIGWFVGLYLAEGSMGYKNSLIQIASHQKEQERFIKLKEIALAYGGTCRMHKTSDNGATINLYGRVLIGIIEQYISGKTSHDKHLTVNCWQRSDAFLWQVLSGYLDGDGHYDQHNDRWRIGFTRNYNLEQDLRTLCARLDVQLRLKLSEATNQHGTFKSFRGEIRFNRSEHYNTKQDGEIVKINRSRARKFWDIGVEDSPHLFALASGVLTHNSKPNPMPESVTDRPTTAHEYIFLLTKAERYWYDAEAVKEAVISTNDLERRGDGGNYKFKPTAPVTHFGANLSGRNRRSVWTVATTPFSGSHFAVFPPALIRPCILAGCPAMVCEACGEPWERVVEREKISNEKPKNGHKRQFFGVFPAGGNQQNFSRIGDYKTTTLGFQPTCACNAGHIPGVVFDPFFGSGTVGQEAIETGRRWLGCELNPDYIELAKKRIYGSQPALFPAV